MGVIDHTAQATREFLSFFILPIYNYILLLILYAFTFSFLYCSPTLSNIPCNPRGAIIHGTVDIRHRVMTAH